MNAAIMVRQLRIVEIIMICVLAKSLYGSSLHKKSDQARIKRGYSSYAGNDFGSSVHVSSGVIQYKEGNEHSVSSDAAINIGHSDNSDVSLDLPSKIGSSWPASDISAGFEAWLEPLPHSNANSALDSQTLHVSSITPNHGVSSHIVNTDFADDLSHSQLHTKIFSSSLDNDVHGHGLASISDNIDFANVADIKPKNYVKSHGK